LIELSRDMAKTKADVKLGWPSIHSAESILSIIIVSRYAQI
jgi:hypothetical protein